jgi:hypothetical protein
VEQLIGMYNGGKQYPLVLRDDLIKTVPPWKARFLNYKDYAIQDNGRRRAGGRAGGRCREAGAPLRKRPVAPRRQGRLRASSRCRSRRSWRPFTASLPRQT